MNKTGSNKFVSLDPVFISDWTFKVSDYNGIIMVLSFNSVFQYSHVRFFEDEIAAKDFVDYMISREMIK